VARVKVSTVIAAPPEVVWEELRHIERHVDWMADAEAIRFTSRRREGKGTTFECDTRIGPFRLVDIMEVTEWRTARTMGVRHTGLVTGTGRFTLRRAGRRGGPPATRFTWNEKLTFPWWMGGPVGGVVGGRVMKVVWKRNLRRLRARIEG
jgi:carbon monoxide dehydrogenase subunit G